MTNAMPVTRHKARTRAEHLPAVGGTDRALVSRRLVGLLEQLAAMRLDLVNGIIPRVERIGLTRDDLEYVIRRLDDAIAAGRGIAESLDALPAAAASDGRRSEHPPVKAREVS